MPNWQRKRETLNCSAELQDSTSSLVRRSSILRAGEHTFFVQVELTVRSYNQENSKFQADLEKAHSDAFENVCAEINEDVVVNRE